MRVTEVHFNHDTASASSDAINLRQDGQSLITAPEWVDGTQSQPAAYACGALTGPVTIKARFSGMPPNATLRIRAIGQGSGRWGGATTVLGNVAKRHVSFHSNGESGLEEFGITGRVSREPAGVSYPGWKWQVHSGGQWVHFDTTRHAIYVIPALPTAPWGQDIAEPPGEQLPWVAALEKACEWAAGATTVEEAAALIAKAINEHPKHKYDPAADQFVQSNAFQLAAYLSDLDIAGSIAIDCSGTSMALITFANLLGAGLVPLRIRNCDYTRFYTKPVRPFLDPNWTTFGFSWHRIAVVPGTLLDSSGAVIPNGFAPHTVWPGGIGQEQLIYDACLHVNEIAPLFPVRMRLGLAGPYGSDYRHHLIDIGTVDCAIPLPLPPAE